MILEDAARLLLDNLFAANWLASHLELRCGRKIETLWDRALVVLYFVPLFSTWLLFWVAVSRRSTRLIVLCVGAPIGWYAIRALQSLPADECGAGFPAIVIEHLYYVYGCFVLYPHFTKAPFPFAYDMFLSAVTTAVAAYAYHELGSASFAAIATGAVAGIGMAFAVNAAISAAERLLGPDKVAAAAHLPGVRIAVLAVLVIDMFYLEWLSDHITLRCGQPVVGVLDELLVLAFYMPMIITWVWFFVGYTERDLYLICADIGLAASTGANMLLQYGYGRRTTDCDMGSPSSSAQQFFYIYGLYVSYVIAFRGRISAPHLLASTFMLSMSSYALYKFRANTFLEIFAGGVIGGCIGVSAQKLIEAAAPYLDTLGHTRFFSMFGYKNTLAVMSVMVDPVPDSVPALPARAPADAQMGGRPVHTRWGADDDDEDIERVQLRGRG